MSGIHTSWKLYDSTASCLAGKGYTFVGRYIYSTNVNADLLTLSEAQTISKYMYIVTVFENGGGSTPSYFTNSQGSTDGESAFLSAYALNQTANTPVYFAVDFDATTTEKQSILDYFSGIETGYQNYMQYVRGNGGTPTAYQIGVYGSYDVLDWCKTQGVCTYFWQAYAAGWSGGRNANDWPGYNLRQTGSNLGPDSSTCNVAIDTDKSNGSAGGWKI